MNIGATTEVVVLCFLSQICPKDSSFTPMKYPMLNYRNTAYFVYPRKDAKGIFYYRFTHGQESYHKSTKMSTRKEAILRAQEAIDQAMLSASILGAIQPAGSPILAQVLLGYLAGKKTLLAPSTYRTTTLHFRYLEATLGTLKIDQITVPVLHGYLNDLHKRLKPANSYWKDILTRYNQFFVWCILTDKVSQNPLRGYPRPKMASLNVYEETISDEELETLCAHLNQDDEFAIRCFRYMGTYPMDYALAEKQNFYMKDGVLTFNRKRGKNTFKFNQPLDGRIEEAIKQKWLPLRSPNDRMFWHGTLEQYRSWYYCLQKRVYRAWHHCGLGEPKKLGAFRHTFCTEAIERGVPEDVVLEWAGYSKGSTVLRKVYLHRKSTTRYRYVQDASTVPDSVGL